MSNTKHTPGPWKHSSFQVWAQGEAGNTFGTLVASLRRSPATDDVATADANLIAAAPELLEAAQSALKLLDEMMRGHDEGHTAERLRSAIAKATRTK